LLKARQERYWAEQVLVNSGAIAILFLSILLMLIASDKILVRMMGSSALTFGVGSAFLGALRLAQMLPITRVEDD
jgi:hypothetical protein